MLYTKAEKNMKCIIPTYKDLCNKGKQILLNYLTYMYIYILQVFSKCNQVEKKSFI